MFGSALRARGRRSPVARLGRGERADGDAGCVSHVSAWVARVRGGGLLALRGVRMGREGDAP